MLRLLPRVTLAALSLSLSAQAQEIGFGIIATDSASTQRERWEPFFRDMEKKTGLKINAFYAPDYAGVIEAMRFNKIQVAWYGNKAAMEAVDRAQGEVFAQAAHRGAGVLGVGRAGGVQMGTGGLFRHFWPQAPVARA